MMGVRALQCTSPPLSCTHLSSFHLFLLITVTYFFYSKSPRESGGWGHIFLAGCLDGWMQGIQRDGPAVWYYSSAGSQGSVLALTARDVRGKSIGEVKGKVICTGLCFDIVKTQATTHWKQSPVALYHAIKPMLANFLCTRMCVLMMDKNKLDCIVSTHFSMSLL